MDPPSSLGFAAVGAAGAGDALPGGNCGCEVERIQMVMGPPALPEGPHLFFSPAISALGLGSLLGRGWEEKREKHENTRNREWERQRQKKSYRSQEGEKWRSLHRFADKSLRLYHLGRWVLFTPILQMRKLRANAGFLKV